MLIEKHAVEREKTIAAYMNKHLKGGGGGRHREVTLLPQLRRFVFCFGGLDFYTTTKEVHQAFTKLFHVLQLGFVEFSFKFLVTD